MKIPVVATPVVNISSVASNNGFTAWQVAAADVACWCVAKQTTDDAIWWLGSKFVLPVNIEGGRTNGWFPAMLRQNVVVTQFLSLCETIRLTGYIVGLVMQLKSIFDPW